MGFMSLFLFILLWTVTPPGYWEENPTKPNNGVVGIILTVVLSLCGIMLLAMVAGCIRICCGKYCTWYNYTALDTDDVDEIKVEKTAIMEAEVKIGKGSDGKEIVEIVVTVAEKSSQYDEKIEETTKNVNVEETMKCENTEKSSKSISGLKRLQKWLKKLKKKKKNNKAKQNLFDHDLS